MGRAFGIVVESEDNSVEFVFFPTFMWILRANLGHQACVTCVFTP